MAFEGDKEGIESIKVGFKIRQMELG